MPARAIFKNSRADLQEEVSIKTPPTPARRSIPSRSNSHHDQLSLALNISTTPATSDMVSLVHGPPSDAPAAYSDNLWEAQAKAQAAAAAEWPAAMFVRGYVITPIQSAIRAATSRLATVTAAPGVRLALAAAALILATALLSAVGLSSGDSPYLVGTVLAPLKPNSHIFTHGFRSSATHEYAVTLLALPVGEAEQTHEIYFDEGSRTAFSTMVGSSRLIQVPFDRFGRMADHVQEWTVGHPAHNPHPEEAGLHNVAGSDRFPGCIWIATETDDRVYLVDPSDGFRVLYEMHTPTTLVTGSGVIHHVGGPHSVREGHSGEIWVALKGSNYDGPGYDDPKQAAYYKAMMDKHFMDENEPVPDGWAVWRVHPDAYNASAAPAKGGIMWEAYESPTMTAIDGVGNAWTTQDRTDYILHVDTAGVATQVKLPEMVMDDGEVWSFKNGNGPGIATDPQGAVWLTNLGQARPWLVKFHAGSTDPMIFKDLERLGGPADAGLHTIHVAFSATGGPHRDTNVMYVLTSALLTPGSVEAVIVQEMDEDWVLPVDGAVGHQKIVLTSVNSAAHRIAIAESTEPRSILVSGLLSNTLYQISGRSI